MASGWMMIRGIRRRRGFERGFVVSDHADFPGLIQAIEASRARRVLVTHGFTDSLARLLCERGYDASVLPTRFTGEGEPDVPDEVDA
jgi:putative mRNA 3-end processing factor